MTEFDFKGALDDLLAEISFKNYDLDLSGVDSIRAALRLAARVQSGELVVVPKRLTAENGAKAVLIGEFHEEYEDSYDQGDTVFTRKVPVSWTTIKAIWDMAIEHFAPKHDWSE